MVSMFDVCEYITFSNQMSMYTVHTSWYCYLYYVFTAVQTHTNVGAVGWYSDATTVKNLELISNAHNPSSGHSLFGVLSHTKTSMGTRLLRANILQPPYGESIASLLSRRN